MAFPRVLTLTGATVSAESSNHTSLLKRCSVLCLNVQTKISWEKEECVETDSWRPTQQPWPTTLNERGCDRILTGWSKRNWKKWVRCFHIERSLLKTKKKTVTALAFQRWDPLVHCLMLWRTPPPPKITLLLLLNFNFAAMSPKISVLSNCLRWPLEKGCSTISKGAGPTDWKTSTLEEGGKGTLKKWPGEEIYSRHGNRFSGSQYT